MYREIIPLFSLQNSFMVSATSPEVTRMVMASGTNKWASRVVVILQLAAWSAVGIVLLQKGISSLQKRPTETRNVTQTFPTKSSGIYHQDNKKNLLDIPIDNENNSDRQREKKILFGDDIWNKDSEFLNDQQYTAGDKQNLHSKISGYDNKNNTDDMRVMESMETAVGKDLEKELSKEEIIGKKKYPSKKTVSTKLKIIEEDKDIDEFNTSSHNSKELLLPIKLMNDKLLSSESVDTIGSKRQLTKTAEISSSGNSQQSINSNQMFDNTTNNDTVTTSPSPAITTKSGGAWESRRRLRLSHLSGGGAAAAVAMVAVGAVMLVLGPAVIVLRALDERRQERRFLKLSGRDDLPPSYEQATLMDEAPRYSSLSLNTILGPPPPPSPTPARVHVV
ncbi:hypothetical protein PV327_002510 [Microctonus hyperodae]|uniref:Uncharacterized protein n=1 Tax=Microctonus hyperodae TaxID=165561 RepID=A0AA39FG47_MICHY|nr:hypothetical protein PV327_002510 [Microctonus hyperodae]